METNRTIVLAGIDGSGLSNAVCDYAAWISGRVDAPLQLLHNIEHRHTAPASDLSGSIGLGSQERLLTELTEVEQQRSRLMMKKGKLLLAAARERAIEAGIEEPLVRQRHDTLCESLIELEDAIRVLVLGIRGEDHKDDSREIGTQLETIIRALHRPILIVNKDFTPPQQVMLAFDGSEPSRKALDMVARSPLFKGLPCHLVHVGHDDHHAARLLNEGAEKLAEAGFKVVVAELIGRGCEALCDYQAQHNIDLTIMGAFGHTRIRELLLGSFTAKMLSMSQKPLLLLR